jgi:LysR family transcriptional regulator, hca operon transcriptional activator
MELRHLRYFIAVVEEGSFTAAAERRLHTAQPSLSRQIRDLELELGTELIVRGTQGLTLTVAGQVFLEHARFILARVEIARMATQRAARSAKTSFVVGFLSGYEVALLPEVLSILRDQLSDTELTPISSSSPELTRDLISGKVDLAFIRPYDTPPELALMLVAKEPLVVIMPRDHPMGGRSTIRLEDISRETLISISRPVSPALRRAIDEFVAQSGVTLAAGLEADHLHMAFTLVLSTPGVCILGGFARRLLPPSVVGIPLEDGQAAVDLAIAYNRANPSPILQHFLSEADALIARRPLGAAP